MVFIQLKFDIYYLYNENTKDYFIYRLLPRPRKIVFRCEKEVAGEVDHFMRELEMGNKLTDDEQIESLKTNLFIRSIYLALVKYRMVITPDVVYDDSPYKRQLEMFEA